MAHNEAASALPKDGRGRRREADASQGESNDDEGSSDVSSVAVSASSQSHIDEEDSEEGDEQKEEEVQLTVAVAAEEIEAFLLHSPRYSPLRSPVRSFPSVDAIGLGLGSLDCAPIELHWPYAWLALDLLAEAATSTTTNTAANSEGHAQAINDLDMQPMDAEQE
jgi:hypothetical protein